jgi:hypothetical protein
MDASDLFDPNDAVLQDLLAQIAENTQGAHSRDKIIDLILTPPPIAEWPPEKFDVWRKTYQYIRSLRRDHEVRQLERMFDDSDVD